MAISGLVVVLSSDADEASDALTSLARDARLTLGERFGRRIAMVAETPGVEADRELWDDLRELRGVEYVDVTFVSLDAEKPVGGEPAAQENVYADR